LGELSHQALGPLARTAPFEDFVWPLLLLGLLAFLSLLGVLLPREMWTISHAWRSWQYKDPDALEPSDLAVASYRLMGIVGVVLFVGLGGFVVTRNIDERRCEDAMEKLGDAYDQDGFDGVRRRAEELGLEAERAGGPLSGSIVIYDGGERLGELYGRDGQPSCE
jgi:hypothetical protein